MKTIWYYSHRHFVEDQTDRYINKITGIFQTLSEQYIGTSRPELGRRYCALPVELA